MRPLRRRMPHEHGNCLAAVRCGAAAHQQRVHDAIIGCALHAQGPAELLRAGKTGEAVAELHRAEADQPANLQLALDCDSELRKQGAAGEADALYQRMLGRHEALCRDFPRSGTYHNDLAWLAANLDRDLDKALAHAQRAVELEPQSAGILDTLAEVHFRRGNRAEAVRLANAASQWNRTTSTTRSSCRGLKQSRSLGRNLRKHTAASTIGGRGMRQYTVIYERGPRNWSAYAPDLPGCIATAKTPRTLERRSGKRSSSTLKACDCTAKPSPP